MVLKYIPMLREEVGILVVDDVNAVRVQVRELLKTFGFKRILIAANGAEAIQMLNSEQIQLVMADWSMLPTDGMELLKYIRSHPQHQDTSFVMVTAESIRERVIEAIQAGVDDYIVKPLTAEQIQSKVYGVLLKKKVI